MLFKNLIIKNFRNLVEVNLQFSNQLNIFIGQNGQGKTNIVESLFLLARGESFRFSSNSDLIRFNSEVSILKSKINENSNLEFEARLILEKNKKSFLLNEKKISYADMSKKFKIVLFSPESLSSIKDGPEQRRNLIDELVVNNLVQGSSLIADYKKILRTRNKILKDYKSEIITKETAIGLIESVNPLFLKSATQLTMARLKCINEITKDLHNAMSYISSTPVEIMVDYVVSGAQVLSKNTQEIAEILRKRMKDLAEAELASGSSLIGPHKHDILFLYNQKDSRIFCSQGQQRALILSFKIAQIVYHRRTHGIYPVLMLDDVMSELDNEKQTKLVSFLNEIKTQIFITTTDIQLPHHLTSQEHAVFHVKEGNCVRTSTS